jgi:hypothetical protein
MTVGGDGDAEGVASDVNRILQSRVWVIAIL